jgi:hypothetical protein
MSKVELNIGTRVYNNGDMANQSHFGTVTDIKTGRFGTQIEITPDADSDRTRPYFVPPCAFSQKFLGHSGTRFVTEAAYREWRQERLSAFAAASAP